jgi:4-carboxymuconolactone decarboxylase
VTDAPRLAPLTEHDLDERQRALWDIITSGGRGPLESVLTSDGALIGPFNALLRSPEVGQAVIGLDSALRANRAVGSQLRELVILMVGGHWQSSFEFWAHRQIGIAVGLDEAHIDAIAAGGTPRFERDDEAAVFAFFDELLRTRRVSPETYRRAVATVGETGLVDLITLTGSYTIVSLLLNSFVVPVPEGEVAPWPISPLGDG